jgi:hypothetical protein
MNEPFPADFLDLLTELNRAEAKVMLVGGHAVAFHGRPRATKDFDLWMEATPDNAARVLTALRAFGAPLGTLVEQDLAQPGHGFRMGVPPLRIEVLTEISGVTFEEAWPRRATLDLEGLTVAVIGRDDLLQNKRAAGRPQDLADVDVLERQAGRGDGWT